MSATARPRRELPASLCRLTDPDVLADPWPLYRRMADRGSVFWDPYLHAWTVTGYADSVKVLQTFSADRSPSVAHLEAMGLGSLAPVAGVMTRQMLFLDPPVHSRLREACSAAFSTARVKALGTKVSALADRLLDDVGDGEWDLMAAFAEPLPAIVAAEALGLPSRDWETIKRWSASFARLLGNFQHSPDQAAEILRSTTELSAYVEAVLETRPSAEDGGLIGALLALPDGRRPEDADIVANVIVTLVGGLETTTNLIACGMMTLRERPGTLAEMGRSPDLLRTGVEELLRWESPSQHTARIANEDMVLGGCVIREGDAVMVVMAAANRDPSVFPDPDAFDPRRTPNRHLAFGWGPHFCFGAALARLEAKAAFSALASRHDRFEVDPTDVRWRDNLGLRGPVSVRMVPVRGEGP